MAKHSRWLETESERWDRLMRAAAPVAKNVRLLIAFWCLCSVRAQDLAPAVIGDMLLEETPTSGVLAPTITELLASNGVSYLISSIDGPLSRPRPYFWTKTGATTGTLEFPTSSSPAQTFLTFGSPRSGVYRTGINSGTFLLIPYATTANAPLRNLSARVLITGSQPAMVGFVVAGSVSRKVLIRAVGPSLAGFGVTRPALQPVLSVWSGSSLLAENSGWGGDPALTDAFAAAGAFALPRASRDCALLLSVAPGNYTARVGAQNGEEALVEIYYVD